MATRATSLTILCLAASLGANAQEKDMSHAAAHTESRTRVPAAARVAVQSSEAKPYDQSASPALVEVKIEETFTGDIDGQSPVRALQVRRDDRSASMVSVQRFHGKVRGRQGTFVL